LQPRTALKVKKMNVEKKSNGELKSRKETIEAFVTVHAKSGSALSTDKLVPIYEEYDKRNSLGEEKAFRLIPRKFATNLLKFQGNLMIPEENFNESEKRALKDFVKKSYVKSAKVGGKTVYFDLNPKIRRYLINILKHRN
jgi:hypothetical protein